MKMFRPGRTNEYILQRDINSEQPTLFTLRGLKWKELDEVNVQSAMSMNQAFEVQAIYKQAADEDRDLSDDERMQVQAISPMDAAMMHRLNEQHATACKYGLLSVGELYDENGKPFTLSADEFIELAPGEDLRELGAEIIKMSRYSEDELKN